MGYPVHPENPVNPVQFPSALRSFISIWNFFGYRQPTMFHPPFESFRQLVFQDPSLQVQLHAVTDAVQFSLRAAQLGAERGCQFSADEVNAALLATSHAWHMREFTRQSQPIT
ncbi:Nif11 family protein, partial [Tabrizicola sp.]|uniref:Nif11-like leader peptide family natural product precursor n=1 Tax=Tabrizicola sp. TaxID=2005166 RepID=UPI00286A047E